MTELELKGTQALVQRIASHLGVSETGRAGLDEITRREYEKVVETLPGSWEASMDLVGEACFGPIPGVVTEARRSDADSALDVSLDATFGPAPAAPTWMA